jgi:hypothetical protein
MTVSKLFEGAPKAHRRVVGAALGLGKGATGAEVAAALLDPERLPGLLAALSPPARALAGRLAFGDGSFSHYGAAAGTAPALELERYGVLYAFASGSWAREYHLPVDLGAPVRRALGLRHSGAVAPGSASRFVAAPLQTAHDAAVLAAFLERSPARVKADGEIYQRFWPKLAAALPPVDGLEDDLVEDRLELALRFLREQGFLRVRVDDRPGGDGRRELVPAGDLSLLLAVDGEELRGRLLECAKRTGAASRASALACALAGSVVEVGSFGRALRGLLEETGTRVGEGWRDEGLALLGLVPLWLAGAAELGLDASGRATAAGLRAPELALSAGRPAVCQSNFELVLLRVPSPAERLALERLCERQRGQSHVYRLTRTAVRTAASSGLGAAGVLARLGALAGELPQNVERSVGEWAGSARRFRLRSALFLDAGDPAVAEDLAAGPLRGLVAERLGERLLAIAAEDVAMAERKLAAAAYVLEPGLDRVSGTWHELPASRDADYLWRPSKRRLRKPPGRQVSTLERASASPGAAREVIAEALRLGCDIALVCTDAGATTARTVTPIEVAANRLHAWCHECDAPHALALDSIERAALVA